MQRMGVGLGALALLAMLMRAVVPAGYMLAEADTGQGRVLILQACNGHAAGAIDLDTGKQVDPSKIAGKGKTDGEGGPPCVFASAASIDMPVAISASVEFLTTQDAAFAVDLSVRPGRGIAAPPPPSTGPPVTI